MMKKFTLILLLGALATVAWGQPTFLRSGRSAAELFTAKDSTLVTAEGDINKDGIKDLVIALDGTVEVNGITVRKSLADFSDTEE